VPSETNARSDEKFVQRVSPLGESA